MEFVIKRKIVYMSMAYILGIMFYRYVLQYRVCKHIILWLIVGGMLILSFVFIVYFNLDKYKMINIKYKETDKEWERIILIKLGLISIILYILFSLGLYKTMNFSQQLELKKINQKHNYVIEGIVENVESKENSDAITLKPAAVYDVDENSISYDYKILLYSKKDNELKIGDYICTNIELSNFENATNLGQFDEKEYYNHLKGYNAKGFINDVYDASDLDMYCQKISKMYHIDCKKIINNIRKDNWIKIKYINIKRILYDVKDNIKNHIASLYKEDDASILDALLIGDKSLLNDNIKENFQDSGVIHILSISGMHVALIYAMISILIKRLDISLQFKLFIAMILIIIYAIMTGMSISTNRAMLMFIIMQLARMVGRSYDVISALALSAFIILFYNPYELFGAGFLLSFLAVFGIAFIYKIIEQELGVIKEYLYRKVHITDKIKLKVNKKNGDIVEENFFLDYRDLLRKLVKYIKTSMIISFSINIMILPVILNFYYEFTWISFITNMFVTMILPILFYLAIISIVLTYIWGMGGIAEFVSGSVKFLSLGLQYICELNSNVPAKTISTGKPDFWKIILYYTLISIVIYLKLRANDNILKENAKSLLGKRVDKLSKSLTVNINIEDKWLEFGVKKSKILLYIITILAIVILFLPPIRHSDIITFIDVGQGDCILIQTKEGKNIMVDCGSTQVNDVAKYRVVPYLKYRAITKLDYVFCSHMDKDHVSGIEQMIEMPNEIHIDNIMLSDVCKDEEETKKLCYNALNNGISVSYIKEGDYIKGKNFTIECIEPDSSTKNASKNANSQVLLYQHNDFTMLLTGDVEGEGENHLIDKLKNMKLKNESLKIDILKVAHHGSKNSTKKELLEIIKPRYAIISAGKDNRYGHPHKETLERLEKEDSTIISTIENGAIVVFG